MEIRYTVFDQTSPVRKLETGVELILEKLSVTALASCKVYKSELTTQDIKQHIPGGVTFAGPGWIAPLDEIIFDDPVEDGVVVIPIYAHLDEVATRL